MNNKLIALTLGVAVAGLIGFFFFNDKEETPIVAQKTPVILEALIEEDQPQEQKIIVKVIYTAEGFSPKTVELSVGDSIEFANENTRDMWVGGNLHPTHSLYPEKSANDCLGSSFDTCTVVSTGKSWTFTFNQKGDWGYHNHVYPGHRGNVIVK